jgi:hypothetical protein
MGINSTSKVSPHDCDLMIRYADKPPPVGVAYQLIENDPLVNTTQCELDAALMKQLGANTIRVYHVDSTADHNGCMNAFATAGIYLIVDMDTVGTYIGEVSLVEKTHWQIAD